MSLWDTISQAADDQWDKLVESGEQAFEDFKDVGLPALIKSGAERGIEALTAVRADASSDLQNNVQAILQRPSDPDSWFSRYVAGDIQVAGLKTYGPWIIAGLAGVLVVGMYLKGAK